MLSLSFSLATVALLLLRVPRPLAGQVYCSSPSRHLASAAHPCEKISTTTKKSTPSTLSLSRDLDLDLEYLLLWADSDQSLSGGTDRRRRTKGYRSRAARDTANAAARGSTPADRDRADNADRDHSLFRGGDHRSLTDATDSRCICVDPLDRETAAVEEVVLLAAEEEAAAEVSLRRKRIR